MTAIYGFDIPDYGLIETNPVQFTQDFQTFVAQLTAHQSQAGDLQETNQRLQLALDEATNARAELETRATHAEDAQAALQAQHNIAVAAYRQAMLNGDPSIPPELVQGETVDDVDNALEKARGVVQYIRDKVVGSPGGAGVPGQTATAPTQPPRVPSAAPGRTLPDVSGMTAREKLVYGTSRMAG